MDTTAAELTDLWAKALECLQGERDAIEVLQPLIEATHASTLTASQNQTGDV